VEPPCVVAAPRHTTTTTTDDGRRTTDDTGVNTDERSTTREKSDEDRHPRTGIRARRRRRRRRRGFDFGFGFGFDLIDWLIDWLIAAYERDVGEVDIVECEEDSKGVGGDFVRAADELQRGAERG
jgi:hypothetical protein